MKARVFILASLIIWVLPSAVWSQDAPAPYYAPSAVPAPPPPNAPLDAVPPPQQVPYNSPPGSYQLPPGAVVLVPGQPYAYAYPPPGPYGAYPAAQPVVLTPAPPLASYRWSVAADALFLGRSNGGSEYLGYTRYNSGSHAPQAMHSDRLYSDDVFFPLEAGLRLEISRKFNDNAALSATYWGLQRWSVGDTIYGDPDRQTVLAYSPYLQLPTLLHGLDNSLGYANSSEIQNAEFNAQFRLSDDPYWKLDWLLGGRYVYFADRFSLNGSDELNSALERLDFNTANNLVGLQTGLLFVKGWDRFQWEIGLKVGLMANIYHQRGIDAASDPFGIPAGFTPYDVSHNGGGFSALFEFTLGARFRLTDKLWFRLGYQFTDITGVALAPRQLEGFNHSGNAAFDGLSLGLQATW